ncbi:BspA family leucine-rich repeat surface protein [Williamsoniiplasma luminosum]|uniref:BspA family leucine-rich repeat surface protein n=1 Tax=Williamsoniiplasma luminosum TaxID=214888 RepID=UPI0004702CE0|nr:BspA family leucine-rich repeat surface protein [Williamsoniiplasma luminosum]
MKLLLSLLGTLGLASTSTTTVVALAETSKANANTYITKENLTKLIADAQALAINEKSKPLDAYQKLHKAIGQAKGTLEIYLNETENTGVLDEAYAELTTAIDVFKATKNELAQKETLKTRIANAKNILKTYPGKLETEKQKLNNAIVEAEGLVQKETPRKDQDIVDQTLLKLQNAMVSFLNSTNEKANYTKLNQTMVEAKKALTDHPKKDPGAINALTKAIANAQWVIDQKYTSSDQILVDKAVDALKAAIKKFLDAGKERANTDKLEAIIVDYRNISQWHKSDQAWLVFQQAIEHAQGVVDGQPTLDKQQVVDQEVKNLNQAKTDFNKAENAKADLQWLNSNIKMARTIKIMNKKKSDWDVFQSAIVKAENYVKNPPLIDKQDEVDQMAEDLWQATYKFLNAGDRKDIRSIIFWKTSIGVLKDNKPETIKQQLETKYPTLKEGRDYTIGSVKEYNNKLGVELTGINDYLEKTVVTFVLDIDNIRRDIDNIIDEKQTAWTQSELQQAIEKKNLDVSNALKVIEVQYEAKLQVKHFKIIADDKYDFSKYKGEMNVFQVIDKENQNKTIYLDPKEQIIATTDSSAPMGVKEIINIGWSSNKQTHRIPSTVEKVPNNISPNIRSLERLFQGAINFNQDISNWDTSNITNMHKMFFEATSFNQNLKTNGNKWNTSKVTDMFDMFWVAKSFNGDISNWDTSSVVTMRAMFQDASAFNQDISKWNTAKVTNMSIMFENASAFNQNLKTNGNSWNVSNVTTMERMFTGATSFNGDISNWNTSKVETFEKLFWKARKFNQDISKWNTAKVTNMRNVFDQAEAFNQNIKTNGNSWNVSNVTDMSTMFWGAKAFNQDISNWSVGKVKAYKEFADNANPNWKKEHKPKFK